MDVLPEQNTLHPWQSNVSNGFIQKAGATEPTLADKVAFLSQVRAYPAASDVVTRETHMSWVFLAGEKAYKLKKPVKFPYLDFSTLERREAACRAELRLNRRLAADVYLGVVPLTQTAHGPSLSEKGQIVDWLVIMHRLDEERMLDHRIAARSIDVAKVDQLCSVLAQFYLRARRVFKPPPVGISEWRRNISINRQALLDSRFHLPVGLVWRIDRAQRRFLAERETLIANRIHAHRIVDGHGDLRPEHICLDTSPKVIDCLEFNANLRAIDPVDELAYLSVECERLGASWVGERIIKRVLCRLRDWVPEELLWFYRCYRATLRARLAIAHLLEPNPRTPKKWPAVAKAYLRIATKDALRIERTVNLPAYHPAWRRSAAA